MNVEVGSKFESKEFGYHMIVVDLTEKFVIFQYEESKEYDVAEREIFLEQFKPYQEK